MTALLLMYHRVCAEGEGTACYFARGTAVTADLFARQLDWLGERLRFVSLPEALTGSAAGPTCALTFDDGYADIARVVQPICAERGIPIAVFPIAGRLAGAPSAAWFDVYYDILHRARRRDGVSSTELGLADGGPAPAVDADLRWWVRGPLKQRLARLEPGAQQLALDQLRATLDAACGDRLSTDLYLSRSELRALHGQGVTIGGHGTTHRRLDALTEAEAFDEIGGSAELLAELGIARPWVFCYPDGGHSESAARLVARHGFSWALTVEPGAWTAGQDPWRVPRHLMRGSTTRNEIESWPKR